MGALRKCVGVNFSGWPKRILQTPGATNSAFGADKPTAAPRMETATLSSASETEKQPNLNP
jgi:hypothetical protein